MFDAIVVFAAQVHSWISSILIALGVLAAAWLYFQSLKAAPWINILVGLAGIAVLTLEPFDLLNGHLLIGMPVSACRPELIFLCLLSGAGLLLLSITGGQFSRRYQSREAFRRELWERVANR